MRVRHEGPHLLEQAHQPVSQVVAVILFTPFRRGPGEHADAKERVHRWQQHRAPASVDPRSGLMHREVVCDPVGDERLKAANHHALCAAVLLLKISIEVVAKLVEKLGQLKHAAHCREVILIAHGNLAHADGSNDLARLFVKDDMHRPVPLLVGTREEAPVIVQLWCHLPLLRAGLLCVPSWLVRVVDVLHRPIAQHQLAILQSRRASHSAGDDLQGPLDALRRPPLDPDAPRRNVAECGHEHLLAHFGQVYEQAIILERGELLLGFLAILIEGAVGCHKRRHPAANVPEHLYGVLERFGQAGRPLAARSRQGFA
mmetsp:Transcript_40830/g.86930  ORF Transcript_40830/g.86930 Transcript_40830/m.86930 type:complete len:315 (-) Transcript_40830:1417-2361(-)